jgi:hypothetical protein
MTCERTSQSCSYQGGFTYLKVPLISRQRMGDGEPIAMDLKISGFAAK